MTFFFTLDVFGHFMVLAFVLGCLELRRVMTELKSEMPDFNPRTMLDFGSGPGTSALAVWDVWGVDGGSSVAQDGEETGKGERVDYNSALYHSTAEMRVPLRSSVVCHDCSAWGSEAQFAALCCIVELGCTRTVLKCAARCLSLPMHGQERARWTQAVCVGC